MIFYFYIYKYIPQGLKRPFTITTITSYAASLYSGPNPMSRFTSTQPQRSPNFPVRPTFTILVPPMGLSLFLPNHFPNIKVSRSPVRRLRHTPDRASYHLGYSSTKDSRGSLLLRFVLANSTIWAALRGVPRRLWGH